MAERRTILIVDDDPAVTDYLKIKLGMGYDLIATNDPTEVVKLACDNRPDLVLCDIDMPVMDGGDVARALTDNESTRDIPLMYLTSIVSDEEVKLMNGQIGGRPGISKQAPTEEILARIKSVIDQISTGEKKLE